MFAAIPEYVNHQQPIVLNDNTTHQQVMDFILDAQLNDQIPPNMGHNEAGIGLSRYRLNLAIDYLSQAHNLQNPHKGKIISRLEAYILNFCSENTNNANIARTLITAEQFNFDPHLKKTIEKIDYASKSIIQKYLHNLKKETSGISPALFLTGLGTLLSGGVILSRIGSIEDKDAAEAQKSAAWAQMGVGVSLTITPFIKAVVKTAIK